MSLLDKVVCPHCKKLTLKGRYCMNCGKELREVPEAAQAPPRFETPFPPQQEEVVEPQSPQQVVAAPSAIEPTITEDVAEERKIVEQLSKLYSWSLRLLDLFLEGEAPLDAFREIYQEYNSRIATLEEKRRDLLKRYEDRLKELSERADNLKVRHEIGEVGDKEYIRHKIEIDREISRLRPKLGILQNPIEIRLADIPSFTESLNNRIKAVREKGEGLGLTQEETANIVSDLQAISEATEVMMEQHRRIKHEIQKIEIRYKIGELKQEEYMTQKQRLERQLELTF